MRYNLGNTAFAELSFVLPSKVLLHILLCLKGSPCKEHCGYRVECGGLGGDSS